MKMSNKDCFIDSIEKCIKKYPEEFSEQALEYFENFKNAVNEKKEEFTENGKIILRCLQEHAEKEMWKAKDIADIIELSSRTVSGSIRKLVNDGYVEKTGKNPVIYTITNKGKEIEIN